MPDNEDEFEEVEVTPNKMGNNFKSRVSEHLSQLQRQSTSLSSNKRASLNTVNENEPEEEGQLSVDVYQTPGEIVVQTMVAGVRPEDLQISISRDMVTIKGKREEARTISEDNYFAKELYWGTFSRTIVLPQEIDPEGADAIERHGLLIIKMPKMDRERKTSLKVKSI